MLWNLNCGNYCYILITDFEIYGEHLNKIYDRSYNLDKSLEDDIKNWDNSLNAASSDFPDRQCNSLSYLDLIRLS